MQISGRSLAAALVVTASLGSWQPTPQAWLIQRENLVYTGAFRLPRGADTQHSFEYGGTALAFNPAHATLLLVGHDWHQRVAEIDIPEARQGASLAELSTATLRQPFTDVLAGRLGAVGPGAKIGGLLPFGDQLLVSAYVYYDATRSQAASHYLSSLDFARVADVKGPYTIGSSQAGFVAGYMTMIPPEWQAPFGGIALTGQCCLSIISRTSLGPSLTVFSPSDVGTKTKVAGRMVLGYPIEHPALGDCYGKGGTLFNCAVIMGGVVFPPGTGSLLFFGRLGQEFCYGEGTADQKLHRQPLPNQPAVNYCYDPLSAYKGAHAYPYAYQVWAYDARDLVAVKTGKRAAWQIRPYATWTLDLPFQPGSGLIGGAAYDPATQRLFLSALNADGRAPLILVFDVRKEPR